jgi:hypothetical protein
MLNSYGVQAARDYLLEGSPLTSSEKGIFTRATITHMRSGRWIAGVIAQL